MKLSANFLFAVGNWEANVNGNYTWTPKTLFTNLADATNPNSIWLCPSYGVANLGAGSTTQGKIVNVTVFIKNLFDEHHVDGKN